MGTRQQQIFRIYEEAERLLASESISVDRDVLDEAFASVYSPGPSFQYLFDFSTMSLVYTSPDTSSVLGLEPGPVSIDHMIGAIHPDDISYFQQCEETAMYFLSQHIAPRERLFYKVCYQLRLGNEIYGYRLFLHQAIALSVDKWGKISRVLVSHSDISHIVTVNNGMVSFIHTHGKKSYTGIRSVSDLKHQNNNLVNPLTSREIDVVHLLSEGLSSRQIADELGLSYETIRSHRKNILSKLNASNVSQVIARAIQSGWI